MKRLVVAALLALAPGMALADPAEGIWKTATDDYGYFGHVEIRPCGKRFCGTLVEVFNPHGQRIDSPNKGARVLWDLAANGKGGYGKGKGWAPDRNRTYNAAMTVSGDRLSLRACAAGGFCRDEAWTRVK